MSTLAELQSELRDQVMEHWASCEKAGLAHRASNRDQVLGAFDTFFEQMGKLRAPVAKGAALGPIERLYEELSRVNSDADGGLLETDERELLVPVVIEAVAAVGVSPDEFEDGDPGSEFRQF